METTETIISVPRIGYKATEFKAITTQGIYYPLSMDRNFDELKRALVVMQTADTYGIATPVDWQPRDNVIVPTAGSCSVTNDKMESKEEGIKCYDWFFCSKPLSLDKVNHPQNGK